MKIHKKSIKNHLFFSLSIPITITILIIAICAFYATKYETAKMLDSSLVRTGKLLLSLTKHEIIEHEKQDNFIIDLGLADDRYFHRYENKIHFQIWKKNDLIYNSSEDIKTQKPNDEGFETLKIRNKEWRMFVIYDENSQVTIEVMEREDVRMKLIEKILFVILLPISLSFIPIVIIIWAVVNRGLIKLTMLSNKIRKISPLYLKPFDKSEDLPQEIKPLVESLNFLMIRLEESMSKEKKFINYASHELRTPLTIIKTKTQFLIKKYHDNTDLKADLDNLLMAVDRIINLSNQLLVLSRIDTENEAIEKKTINLGSLITKVVQNFAPIANEKNVEITLDLADKCMVKVNKFHVEIMLNNLVDNAIKYSPRNEKIFINLKKHKGKILLVIQNKGKEMSQNDQKRIFDRFYRVEREIDGSGLGLSIVKRISDLHNLKIDFISKDALNHFEVVF